MNRRQHTLSLISATSSAYAAARRRHQLRRRLQSAAVGSGRARLLRRERIRGHAAHHGAVRQIFTLEAPQNQHVGGFLDRLRLALVRDMLHRLKHRKGFPPGLLVTHAKADPLTFAGFP